VALGFGFRCSSQIISSYVNNTGSPRVAALSGESWSGGYRLRRTEPQRFVVAGPGFPTQVDLPRAPGETPTRNSRRRSSSSVIVSVIRQRQAENPRNRTGPDAKLSVAQMAVNEAVRDFLQRSATARKIATRIPCLPAIRICSRSFSVGCALSRLFASAARAAHRKTSDLLTRLRQRLRGPAQTPARFGN